MRPFFVSIGKISGWVKQPVYQAAWKQQIKAMPFEIVT
jgi:hypothetical protein